MRTLTSFFQTLFTGTVHTEELTSPELSNATEYNSFEVDVRGPIQAQNIFHSADL